jgi:hypothetical protein
MDERRKLTLLPEVLPAPRATAGATDPGGPRARTREHMHRLLSVAALSGATLPACQSGYGVVDPLPPPPVEASGPPPGSRTLDESGPDRERGSTANATTPPLVPSTPPTDTPPGYAVVDPLPAPACYGVADQVPVSARWRAAGGGGLTIALSLAKAKDTKVEYVDVAPSAIGAKVVTASGAGSSKQLVLKPDPNATAVTVSVGARCSRGTMTLSISLDLSGKAAAGAAVPVTVQSY